MSSSEIQEFKSFEELVALATAPRNFDFELNSEKRRIQIRPLTGDEAVEMEKLTERLMPPRDKDGLPNESDVNYMAEKKKAWHLREVATCDRCIISFKIPGGTLAEKSEHLRKILPPGITGEIFGQILKITSSPIENGLFTSSAGSTSNLPS